MSKHQNEDSTKDAPSSHATKVFVTIFVVFFLNLLLIKEEWKVLLGDLMAIGNAGSESNRLMADRHLFNAMVDMENLIIVDLFTTNRLLQILDRPELKADKQIKDALKAYSDALARYSKISASLNPVNSYVLIKQLIRHWEEIKRVDFDENDGSSFRKIMIDQFIDMRANNSVIFPNERDVLAAVVAILRFQEIYELDTVRLARGESGADNFTVTNSSIAVMPLSAEDCLELGQMAHALGDLSHTVEWMQQAAVRTQNGPPEKELNILDQLANALQELDSPTGKAVIEQRALHNERSSRLGNAFESGEEWEKYKQLCRNQFKQPKVEITHKKASSKFRCFLKRDKPFLKLAPLKVEIVHLAPLVVIFRGVISEAEINIIQLLAAPKLTRATVLNSRGQFAYAPFRITRTAFVKEAEHPAIQQLNSRIKDMTNLDLETAFDNKVFKYPIGGHYDPHYDFWKDPDSKDVLDPDGRRGNRVATCLFYLSEPSQGGRTVFPAIGLSVAPSVNDALFWYNLLSDGSGDLRTKHAACPVVAGDKWIFTKLINERGQEWLRPCPIDREEDNEENGWLLEKY